MIEMRIVGVRVEMPSHTPILMLTEVDGQRSLPILIGSAEATAIAMQAWTADSWRLGRSTVAAA